MKSYPNGKLFYILSVCNIKRKISPKFGTCIKNGVEE